MRVAASGKAFLLDGSPFQFRGIRYQPEPPNPPADTDHFQLDLATMAAAGYTVISMLPPPASTIEQATASGLRFMVELDAASLKRIVGVSRRERRNVVRDLKRHLRTAVHAWGGSEALLGVALNSPDDLDCSRGNAQFMRKAADELALLLHDEDASLLVAWRSSWPLYGRCPAECDFLIADVELSSLDELAPVLMACHSDVGDRPVVLGNASLPCAKQDGERTTRVVVETAARCGAGGTIAQAWSPREEPESMARLLRGTVRDLDVSWPSMSVVICAYNAHAMLDECLTYCDRLEYPNLEVIVVDDGSLDATSAIARAHPRVRLVTIPHSGLSVARNVGYRCAHGELVVYLDHDAFPSPDWPWYLALAALGDGVGGSGGPNIPPPGEPASARIVSRIPGGPVPQLLGPDRAKHLPGCNMAFWRTVLEELNGFDPVFVTATDDIEFQSRVVQSGRELAYHPAALVWHHRRPGLPAFVRQQRHYGRSQALLEYRYPDRFPRRHWVRKVAWRRRPRSREPLAASHGVAYLMLPRDEDALIELAHQRGVPAAIALVSTAPLGLVRRKLAAPALLATAAVATLFVIDVVLAGEGRRRSERTLELRVGIGALRVLRPLAFRWGHLSGWLELRRVRPAWPPPPVQADVAAETRMSAEATSA